MSFDIVKIKANESRFISNRTILHQISPSSAGNAQPIHFVISELSFITMITMANAYYINEWWWCCFPGSQRTPEKITQTALKVGLRLAQCRDDSSDVGPPSGQPTLLSGNHETTLTEVPFWHLTYWGRVTIICASKLTIIGSDNWLSPGPRQAIIWTNAGIL